MPELSECVLMAKLINRHMVDKQQRRIVFTHSQCHGSNVKGPHIIIPTHWNGANITSYSRGKEILLSLTPAGQSNGKAKKKQDDECINILFHLGMTGCFHFLSTDYLSTHTLPSHARISFHSAAGAIVFEDVRLFGNWHVKEGKPSECFDTVGRSPCPYAEYTAWRAYVLNELSSGNKLFHQPIHELLLEQKLFNGIGNYLRAEILYRAQINPFQKAEQALQGLPIVDDGKTVDVLRLCRDISGEVIDLAAGFRGSMSFVETEGEGSWEQWGQCYGKAGMSKISDSKKRTFWYDARYAKGGKGKAAPAAAVPKAADEKSQSAPTTSTPAKRKRKYSQINTSTESTSNGKDEAVSESKSSKATKRKTRARRDSANADGKQETKSVMPRLKKRLGW